MKRLLAFFMALALMLPFIPAMAEGKPMVIYLDDILGCGGEWRCPWTQDDLYYVTVNAYSFDVDEISRCYCFTIVGLEATEIDFPIFYYASSDDETPLFYADFEFEVSESLEVRCTHMELTRYEPPCEEDGW